MRAGRGTSLTSLATAPLLRPEPPGWLEELVGSGVLHEDVQAGPAGERLSSKRGAGFTLITAVAREPDDSAADVFGEVVASVYRSIALELRRQKRHAVRIWNFVPNIQGPIEGAGDRYMAFNLGRFNAYCDWFGEPQEFGDHLPTSSAVGTLDDRLWVHVLAADEPGRPIENPRQIPAYHYSRRYGLRPPCFARATRVDDLLFIGGTASILGERSSHLDDIEAQTHETFENIAALIAAVGERPIASALGALRSLRVHVREAGDAGVVRSMLEAVAPDVPDVEIVQAPLCRRELLVEIEGVAE